MALKKSNLKHFADADALNAEVARRARILLAGAHETGMCTNGLHDGEWRNLLSKTTPAEGGGLLVDDDHIASLARHIRDDTIYHNGSY